MEQYKTCTKCGQTKPRTAEYFYRNKKSPDGLRPDCAECGRARGRAYAESHAEEARKRVAAWRQKDPQRTRESRSKSYYKNHARIRSKWKEDYDANPQKFMISSRRRRARVKDVPTQSYTAQDVLNLYGTDCHLCGEPIDLEANRSPGKEGWEKGLHLDHVIRISDGGTDLLSNVRPAHGLCNLRKR